MYWIEIKPEHDKTEIKTEDLYTATPTGDMLDQCFTTDYCYTTLDGEDIKSEPDVLAIKSETTSTLGVLDLDYCTVGIFINVSSPHLPFAMISYTHVIEM